MDSKEHLVLHRYQWDCVLRAIRDKGVAIFARPGLGKTLIALRAIQIVNPKRALIIAPLNVILNTWPDEINKWDAFSGLTYCILRKGFKFDQKAQIHLVNPESLHKLNPSDYDFIVTDESSLFKNPRSIRFRWASKFARKAKYRLVLTGTPRPRDSLDLFTQIYLADLGKALGNKYTLYRSRYFDMVPQRYGTDKTFMTYQIKKGAEKLIYKAIRPSAISLDTKGLVVMPELNIRDIFIRLDKTQQAQYDKMEKELFATIGAHEVFSLGSGSAYWKCHQLANGALYVDDATVRDRRFAILHDHKIEALRSLVGELNGAPLLVGYQYEHDRKRIIAAIDGAVEFDSKNLALWNRKEIPVMILQYQKAAYGLNLQHGGSDLCLFSLTDNWANYDQLICRIYRQGAGAKVFVHRIIAKGTIDQVISQRLDRKQTGNEGLIDALKAYRFVKKST
jgi:SNF2 family DNA or RNA helicase